MKLAGEMAYFAKLRPSRRLHVFISDVAASAHEHRFLPVPGRSDWHYRAIDVALLDGTTERLQEPYPSIVFSERIVREQDGRTLGGVLKHELGHLLQDLKASLRNDGYGASFGIHTPVVRTGDEAAFMEGFAEHTAIKFRDSDIEVREGELREVLRNNNRQAYDSLLSFYWTAFRSRETIRTRLTTEVRGAAERPIFEFQWRPQPGYPTPDQFRHRIAELLAGQGAPPLAREEIDRELRALDTASPGALANLADEELTPAETEEIRTTLRELFGQLYVGHARPSFQAGLKRVADLTLRSAEDILMSEGAVALLMSRLDRDLAMQASISRQEPSRRSTTTPTAASRSPRSP